MIIALTLALSIVGSFVALTGIALAYESINQNLADNNHRVALSLVTDDPRNGYIGARPYCDVKSC
jgi:hypothetical protein